MKRTKKKTPQERPGREWVGDRPEPPGSSGSIRSARAAPGCSAAKGLGVSPPDQQLFLPVFGYSCSNCAVHCWFAFSLYIQGNANMEYNEEDEILQPVFPKQFSECETSIRDRSWSSFNRQFPGSSEHPCRKKSPKIMIHSLKWCLSSSLLKRKTSLLIQGSFHSLLACKFGTHNHVTAFCPGFRCLRCLRSPLAEQPRTRRPCPASLRAEAEPSSAINCACSLRKKHHAYQIANGAEIKHSF